MPGGQAPTDHISDEPGPRPHMMPGRTAVSRSAAFGVPHWQPVAHSDAGYRVTGWSLVTRPGTTHTVKPGLSCPGPRAALLSGDWPSQFRRVRDGIGSDPSSCILDANGVSSVLTWSARSTAAGPVCRDPAARPGPPGAWGHPGPGGTYRTREFHTVSKRSPQSLSAGPGPIRSGCDPARGGRRFAGDSVVTPTVGLNDFLKGFALLRFEVFYRTVRAWCTQQDSGSQGRNDRQPWQQARGDKANLAAFRRPHLRVAPRLLSALKYCGRRGHTLEECRKRAAPPSATLPLTTRSPGRHPMIIPTSTLCLPTEFGSI
eukprot:119579-Hanusia_phi.AAC.2